MWESSRAERESYFSSPKRLEQEVSFYVSCTLSFYSFLRPTSNIYSNQPLTVASSPLTSSARFSYGALVSSSMRYRGSLTRHAISAKNPPLLREVSIFQTPYSLPESGHISKKTNFPYLSENKARKRARALFLLFKFHSQRLNYCPTNANCIIASFAIFVLLVSTCPFSDMIGADNKFRIS